MNKAFKIFLKGVQSKCVYLLLLFGCAEDLMTPKNNFENTKNISQVNNYEEGSSNIQFTLKNIQTGQETDSFSNNDKFLRSISPINKDIKICQTRFSNLEEYNQLRDIKNDCVADSNFIFMENVNWKYSFQNGGTYTKEVDISSNPNLQVGGVYVAYLLNIKTRAKYRLKPFFIANFDQDLSIQEIPDSLINRQSGLESIDPGKSFWTPTNINFIFDWPENLVETFIPRCIPYHYPGCSYGENSKYQTLLNDEIWSLRLSIKGVPSNKASSFRIGIHRSERGERFNAFEGAISTKIGDFDVSPVCKTSGSSAMVMNDNVDKTKIRFSYGYCFMPTDQIFYLNVRFKSNQPPCGPNDDGCRFRIIRHNVVTTDL